MIFRNRTNKNEIAMSSTRGINTIYITFVKIRFENIAQLIFIKMAAEIYTTLD